MAGGERALRLFVAAYPAREVVASLQESRRAVATVGVREVPPGQVHLTLQFIGPVDPKHLERVEESVGAACRGVGAFELRPHRLISLPARGPVRVIAAETDAPAQVIELHRRLAQRLARSTRPDPADRFLAHVTLARAQAGASVARVDAPVGSGPFRVDRVVLVRSVLHTDGAEHRAVGEWRLED
ncbi:MAG: RNA 2',3'-cyclic phosphodiesterase [Phycisphaerales bacterium]|nr:RNA 2',3'-cyclic phosphodiesterase [Phycisphaerales bacterium]